MIAYAVRYHSKLLEAFVEHIEIVLMTLLLSLLLASLLTICIVHSKRLSKLWIDIFSILYSIPSLAFFAMLIPVLGLGKTTAIVVLVIYNQYILLRNFLDGLHQVEPAIIEAAIGMGMSRYQVLFQVQLPLASKAIFAGIHLSIISTIGITTIAATINAGGLGTILLDGLRTLNTVKILWGTILSSGFAILANGLLHMLEKKFEVKKES
ncbi:ABC transporter permease [Pelosinus sp. sgz500959]|uniref:ABC transporter permease n=1 Tax=Pelosinus sp. sgz500959 TaxID=3242472 RepID=UPI00366EC4C5